MKILILIATLGLVCATETQKSEASDRFERSTTFRIGDFHNTRDAPFRGKREASPELDANPDADPSVIYGSHFGLGLFNPSFLYGYNLLSKFEDDYGYVPSLADLGHSNVVHKVYKRSADPKPTSDPSRDAYPTLFRGYGPSSHYDPFASRNNFNLGNKFGSGVNFGSGSNFGLESNFASGSNFASSPRFGTGARSYAQGRQPFEISPANFLGGFYQNNYDW